LYARLSARRKRRLAVPVARSIASPSVKSSTVDPTRRSPKKGLHEK